jgi:alginate O-acetyltransferase complex protein AlgI
MLFNSIDFAIFLPVVFLLYWIAGSKNLRLQNYIILAASYIFYGWWDWKFLTLILISTLIDFIVGVALSKTDHPLYRKWWVATSVVLNLALLGTFKYLNFFIENFVAAFSFFGAEIPIGPLQLILPVGISFYTFQTMSYSLDVYKKKIEPTNDFIVFASYVSFFPQLVAGPIERASSLLPQFTTPRSFSYSHAVDGMRQILWGLFKKVVIADSCADYIDMVFASPESYYSSTLLFAALLFPAQVYCDFSGYSDIAIGTARLFGIRLNKNFAFPMFSLTVSEFWRRWHISLYSWFRDYVYFPYFFRSAKRDIWRLIKATFLISALIGFWHGADWTFIIWGLANGVYLSIPILMNSKKRKAEFVGTNQFLPTPIQFIRMNVVYWLIAFPAILFRADGMQGAELFIGHMLSFSGELIPQHVPQTFLLMYALFFVVEWLGRNNEYAIEKTLSGQPAYMRWALYVVIVFLTGMFMQTYENPFIYFNF